MPFGPVSAMDGVQIYFISNPYKSLMNICNENQYSYFDAFSLWLKE